MVDWEGPQDCGEWIGCMPSALCLRGTVSPWRMLQDPATDVVHYYFLVRFYLRFLLMVLWVLLVHLQAFVSETPSPA